MSFYSEVSVKHMLHERDQRCLKKFCIGGSGRKVGCYWGQFRGKHRDRIECVSRSISDINHMRKDDHRSKGTYFIFDFDSDASDFMSKKKLDTVIFNIPNFGEDGIFAMVKLIDKELSPLGTICEISAW
ncbi:hypothetical protein AYI68_g7157 [Smittium mucronatum]|uniref:Uncharacterized protein n=1 Tax=Smittium mucronatum TaxID=133383 RepID=A0A1R0GPH3_9FUNG|nr:hypothetical protein AYI68_g7157 [Smittium mucronatum]